MMRIFTFLKIGRKSRNSASVDRSTPSHSRYILILLLAAALQGCRGEIEVETVKPRCESIEESFTDPARTRLKHTYLITMPLTARIARIDLEPGDRVKKSQRLAETDVVPFEQAVVESRASVAALEAKMAVTDDNRLENSALEELNSTLDAMDELVKAAALQVSAEEARFGHAQKELQRMESLTETQAVSESQVDDAQLHAETSLIDFRKEQFNLAATRAIHAATAVWPRAVQEYMDREQLEKRITQHELTEAKSRLARFEHDLGLTSLLSPIDGVVLERYEQGDGLLAAGTPLMLLGDLNEIEVVADILTQNATRIDPGSPVLFTATGDAGMLRGKVKGVEPSGFTKLSSLGVEQQRVNVIISLEKRPEKLGVGFRLQARFVSGIKEDALVVDRESVLQDTDRSYFVWKIENNVLSKQPVKLGLRSDRRLEITQGLTEEDSLVKQPTALLSAGMRVKTIF
jgi:HlyD family secretion protein